MPNEPRYYPPSNFRSDGKFAKGNKVSIGNSPNGRPPRRITNRLHEELDASKLDGQPVERVIAQKIIEMACAGDLKAIEFLTERVEGKVAQAVELSGGKGGPIQSININMTPEEAIQAYLDAVGNPEVGSDDVKEVEEATEDTE